MALPFYLEAISKIEKRFEVKELLKRTAEYPPAMQVLGGAIITVTLINIWGAVSNPIKGVAVRSNNASGSISSPGSAP